MSFLLSLLGVVVGISTVMLTGSLVVMCMVKVVQALSNTRGKTLGEMVGALNRGFRTSAGDVSVGNDQASIEFVQDILTYPALHDSASIAKAKSAAPGDPDSERQILAQKVEYLAKEDLIEIVRAELEPPSVKPRAGATDPDDVRSLPARWFTSLDPALRTFGDFRLYVERWYTTLEGSSIQRFKGNAQKLTVTMSWLLVILINMDTLELATNIYSKSSLQAQLTSDAPLILYRARQMGVTDTAAAPPTSIDEQLTGVSQTLGQANGVLTEPGLALGWQNSLLARTWCPCNPDPSTRHRLLATIRWLLGLALSSLLLSLGAPFWADQLSTFLNLQNSVRSLVEGQVAKKSKNSAKEDDSEDGS